jgi:hypothetical protein
MMKFVGIMCAVMIAIVVLGGCSAHGAVAANTPATVTVPVSNDWHAALDGKGSCASSPNVSQGAYIECLQMVAKQDRSNAENLAKLLADAKKPDGTQPGPVTGLLPKQEAQAPQHAPPTFQQFMAIPSATGALCNSPKELTLTVTNQTPYLIEVSGGGKLVPFNCDAQQNLAYFDVIRPNGVAERVLAIPPAIDGRPATARFVFMALNGGLGQYSHGSAVEVDFLRYVFQHSNDPTHAIASVYADLPMIAKYYSVPRTDGNWIIIE